MHYKKNNTYCQAKWLQTTLDLYHGVSKSCHHTDWTPIDIDRVRQHPQYLTNTQDTLTDRRLMTEGHYPLSCSFCWEHEAYHEEGTSDRHHKTHANWSRPYKERCQSGDLITTPSYLEVLFDHTCNLKCLYCSADSSSSIENEMKRYGPYPADLDLHRRKRLAPHPQHKELTKHFFSWLPELLPNLHTLRLTGGEPLLSSHTASFIEFLKKTDLNLSHLTLAFNSNLSLATEKWAHFVDDIQSLSTKVKTIELYTSIDSDRDDAAIIRKGLSLSNFWTNLALYLQLNNKMTTVLTVTFNKLSPLSFETFLQEVAQYKKEYPQLILDIVPLKEPSFLSLKALNQQEREAIAHSLDYMKKPNSYFLPKEIQQMMRIKELANYYSGPDNKHYENLYKKFREEIDRR